jgi:hypothetical protein
MIKGGEQAVAKRYPDPGIVKVAMISGAALALVVGWAALSRDDIPSGAAVSPSPTPAPGAQQPMAVPPAGVSIGGRGSDTQQPAPSSPGRTPTIGSQVPGVQRLTPVPPVRTRSSR